MVNCSHLPVLANLTNFSGLILTITCLFVSAFWPNTIYLEVYSALRLVIFYFSNYSTFHISVLTLSFSVLLNHFQERKRFVFRNSWLTYKLVVPFWNIPFQYACQMSSQGQYIHYIHEFLLRFLLQTCTKNPMLLIRQNILHVMCHTTGLQSLSEVQNLPRYSSTYPQNS